MQSAMTLHCAAAGSKSAQYHVGWQQLFIAKFKIKLQVAFGSRSRRAMMESTYMGAACHHVEACSRPAQYTAVYLVTEAGGNASFVMHFMHASVVSLCSQQGCTQLCQCSCHRC